MSGHSQALSVERMRRRLLGMNGIFIIENVTFAKIVAMYDSDSPIPCTAKHVGG